MISNTTVGVKKYMWSDISCIHILFPCYFPGSQWFLLFLTLGLVNGFTQNFHNPGFLR